MNPRPYQTKLSLTRIIIGLCSAALIGLSGCEVVAQPQPTQAPTVPAAIPSTTISAVEATVTSAATDAPTATVQPTDRQNSGNAAAFPDPAGFDWVPVVNGLESPIDIQNAGDGSGRLFIVEKPGRIVILKDGQVLPTPFLDISGKVKSSGSEQGLLGLAFHPQYSQVGTFFVNYIDQNGNTVIARFNVSANDPNQADPGSETDLIHVDQPYPNHNGGSMVFGPDGFLYMGLGDGGSGGDPLRNGQNTNTMLGKILRIDVNHGDPYGIPADNPFAQGGGLAEIWAFGLRNPWRFSFARNSGELIAADVGLWLAIMTRLGLAERTVTTNMQTAFLNAAIEEDIRCTARVLKWGSRQLYGEARCTNPSGKLRG